MYTRIIITHLVQNKDRKGKKGGKETYSQVTTNKYKQVEVPYIKYRYIEFEVQLFVQDDT